MAKRNEMTKKKPIEQYDHKGKQRTNNPPVGLVDAKSDAAEGKKTYAYDPHLDPTLVWAGKAERTSFEIPTVSLHVHERIDPRAIIEAVRKKNGSDYAQLSLFGSKTENPPLREAIEFYKHAHNWSNRFIAGDSLLVMNSLLEKEGMAGQVQMIYFDPPYGIKYGSNFQPFVNKRDVKDGKDEDLTAEPEMVKAFRDTWELGLHSYLSYSSRRAPKQDAPRLPTARQQPRPHRLTLPPPNAPRARRHGATAGPARPRHVSQRKQHRGMGRIELKHSE
jgi:adenine-specific DNA-methyltransferase